MEHRHHQDALPFDDGAVFTRDTQIGLDQLHPGNPAEGDDDPRSDQARLLAQIADTAVLLVLLGIAVMGRTAFDDVGDIDVLSAVEVNGKQHLVEELSGSADKGLTLQILLFARSFADEHDARLRLSDAEYDVASVLA